MGSQLGGDTTYNANQFHFHAPSEHTIDGLRYDFEMHVVHFPNTVSNGIIASAIGIIFDVKNYDPSVTVQQINIIDNFFDSMQMTNFSNPTSLTV